MFSTRFITQRRELSVAIALLCFSSSPSLAGVFQPIGVDQGDVYHLIFTTAGQRDAASRELADYYDFVSQEAAVSGLTQDVAWLPLVSVLRPDAIDDESIDAKSFIEISGPIYNMNGELFSSNGLFGPDQDSPVIPVAFSNYDQFGQELNSSINGIATGTRVDGVGQDPLGAGEITGCLQQQLAAA